MAIPQDMIEAFELLLQAVRNNEVVLIETFDLKEEKKAYLICITRQAGTHTKINPFACMFSENPYERYLHEVNDERN